ncbi:hypothetical protein HPP92_018409 [Vanilla planifolia]|uniref:Uncharacterized protein n=1 Tax=Vanilla planifolia TaxID=51239 RepID=A0A835QGR4_VANPL|nr:hypothetical protein HPP92_019022 [Vanilla planifolia]KAG0469081.1 hypothetical protein HPP92_018409 [Vanilla planifolia]
MFIVDGECRFRRQLLVGGIVVYFVGLLKIKLPKRISKSKTRNGYTSNAYKQESIGPSIDLTDDLTADSDNNEELMPVRMRR